MSKVLELTPDLARAVQAGQQPQLQIAAPMNDVQLIALVAAHVMGDRHREAAQCVADAINIVAEAFVQFQAGKFPQAIDRARARLNLHAPNGSPS
jgi:hypothetical protein